MDFIAAAHADTNTTATLTVNVPTGTQDGDIIFAYLKGTAPFTPPSGWTHLADTLDASTGNTHALYYRIASSEPASYDWTANSGSRYGVTHATFRDGFDTSDPIDVVSDTGYVVNNATLRAASMVVSAVDSPLIFFGGFHLSAVQTISPATNPATFAEHVDTWNSSSRFGREIASVTWSGSGATGDMDATISVATVSKHAFAVALNPDSGQVIEVGQPSETDTALGVAHLKSRSVGLVSETDTAFSLGRLKSRLVGLVTEADSALALVTSLAVAAILQFSLVFSLWRGLTQRLRRSRKPPWTDT